MLSGVISIGVVSTSHFFRRAVRRGISHLCWSSDEIDPLVVVSLYFTLHLYFGNIVNVPFSKQSTRCWGSIDWSYTISLGLFPKRMSIEYAIAKTPQSVVPTCWWHGDSWYCRNMLYWDSATNKTAFLSKQHVFTVRFIDEVFSIWTDGQDSLKEFLALCHKYSEIKIWS